MLKCREGACGGAYAQAKGQISHTRASQRVQIQTCALEKQLLHVVDLRPFEEYLSA